MKSNHYTHSLYYKLLIGYLIFGLLGFITIATISSEMTYHHLVERESEVLYDEATMIADRCSKAYEGKTINLDSAYPQIEGAWTLRKSKHSERTAKSSTGKTPY